jgi:hypothetical protein
MFYTGFMPETQRLARVFDTLADVLDERTRRLLAAAEATAFGSVG